jgi:GT2 family glycosyltransferase
MTETVILPIAASAIPASLPASSLIIPSRNRPELLLAAVRSILQGDDIPTELIIIDQSDAPSTALATLTTDRACKIRYLWTKSVGASRARNAGIAAAQHDILAFTDDDVTVTSTWFGALIRALLCAGPRAVVTGRVLAAMAQTPGSFAPSTKADENPVVYAGRIGEDVLFSNNAAMFRSAIKEVGDFDVRLGPGGPFSNAEDNDLGFRLLEAGYRIVYVPDAVLHHRPWRNERDYLPLRWSYGHGQGAYYAKHLSLTDRYMLWRMVRQVKNHALGFAWRIRRQRRLAYGDAIYLLGFFSGTLRWLLTQRWTR